MRCFLPKFQWCLQIHVASCASFTRTSVGKTCHNCRSSSSASDDSCFEEISVWCFAWVEWHWSQLVHGLQVDAVATSNSLFFPKHELANKGLLPSYKKGKNDQLNTELLACWTRFGLLFALPRCMGSKKKKAWPNRCGHVMVFCSWQQKKQYCQGPMTKK